MISKYHQWTCQGTIKLEPIKCQKLFIDNLEHVFVIIYSIYFILTVIKGCFKYNFNSGSDINGSRIKTQEWKLNLRVVFCSDVLTRNCRCWILPRRYGESCIKHNYRNKLLPSWLSSPEYKFRQRCFESCILWQADEIMISQPRTSRNLNRVL